MLVSVKDAAQRLNMSPRMVQIKAKQFNVKKVGNVYQLTDEIVSNWEVVKTETKIKPNRTFKNDSHPKRKFTPSLVSFVIAFLVLVTIAVSVMFYLDLNSPIVEAKTTITTITIENKKEVNQLSKKLNDAQDVIRNQEIEIQTLKFKDSLRIFKKW